MAKKKNTAPHPSTLQPASAAHKRASRSAAAAASNDAPRLDPSNGGVRPDPTHAEIAEAAYHRYLGRRGAGGSDFDDWLEAERDLRARASSKPL